jgi:hypothetical protein
VKDVFASAPNRSGKKKDGPKVKQRNIGEKARMIVSIEESLPTMVKPVSEPQPEPIEALENQGEFPTLTDQGEQNNPQWPVPTAATR